MALLMKEQAEANQIVNNLVKAATIDLTTLSPMAYHWIGMRAGFDPKSDKTGFMMQFKTADVFGDVMLSLRKDNQYEQFRGDELDEQYIQQVRDMYNKVCNKIELYRKNKPLDDFPYKCTFTFTVMAGNIDEARKEFFRKIREQDIADGKLKLWRG